MCNKADFPFRIYYILLIPFKQGTHWNPYRFYNHMNTLYLHYEEKIAMVHDRISRACGRCGRHPDEVTLIAVTKTQPVEVLQALIDCGVQNLGENRVSEVLEKVPALTGTFIMHLIGALQTNKVAKVLPYIQMIQSVDRSRLIDYLERYLPDGSVLPVLIEVNTSEESTKSGCRSSDARMLVERCLAGKKLRPEGFMTIGPLGGDESAVRNSFSQLRSIADAHRDCIPSPCLSMGMSGDFEWAIEEGSTMVRIGTLLTGER